MLWPNHAQNKPLQICMILNNYVCWNKSLFNYKKKKQIKKTIPTLL